VTIRVGILNVTGYAGIELARLLLNPPEARLVAATGRSLAGQKLGEVFPHLSAYGDFVIAAELEAEVDVVISALPTAASAEACVPFLRSGVRVIDVAADFRLRDPASFEQWYGKPHPAPESLAEAVYGLTELHREAVRGARLVANPGCYPAASLLALAPAMAAGLIEPRVFVDAKSGISGAGRGTGGGYNFSEVNEDVSAYRIANHNHQPEIAQELSRLAECEVAVTFVPPLVPMTRGIHATCYARLAQAATQESVLDLYRERYAGEPFLQVSAQPPHTKHTLGSNRCIVHPAVDERNGVLVAVSVLDNLGKGAAGQAIQNMNVMFGLPETMGLEGAPLFP